MSKATTVYLGQPKGNSISSLGMMSLNGKEISMQEIKEKANKQRFFIRFADSRFPQGIVVPIGYDEPKFQTIDDFIAKAQEAKKTDSALDLAPDKAVKLAKQAKKEGRNVVFSSLCLDAFLNVGYFIPSANIESIGQDADGVYLNLENGKKHHLVIEQYPVQDVQQMEEENKLVVQ